MAIPVGSNGHNGGIAAAHSLPPTPPGQPPAQTAGSATSNLVTDIAASCWCWCLPGTMYSLSQRGRLTRRGNSPVAPHSGLPAAVGPTGRSSFRRFGPAGPRARVPWPGETQGLAQNRLRSPTVENQPSETIADDEDDHADQDAATEGEQGRPAGRERDRDPERSADNRRKKCTAAGPSQELAKVARRSR
jgi:hypothetical protein